MALQENSLALWFLVIPGLVLTACQTGAPSDSLSINSREKPAAVVVAIARVAQKCWFKSGDMAFKKFRMATEVNSYAGRPRILLVPKNDPGGLPSLVVQAEQKGSTTSGKYTNIQTYGPLLGTSNGKRITDDVRRWSKGTSECT